MTEKKQSLGELLRLRIESDKENTRLKLERDAREAGEEAQENLRLVTEFFEKAKAVFSAAILDFRQPKAIQVGAGQNMNIASVLYTYQQSTQVNKAGHKYYPIWLEFANWAAENDLVPEWEYQWDTGGIESWHLLRVSPKKK